MVRSHGPVPPRAAAAAALVSTLALLASAAAADPIAYTFGFGESGQPELQKFDLSTFERESIGPTGGIYPWHLAFHADGTLYGLAGFFGEALRLVSFDVATGAGQVIAELDPAPPGFMVTGFTGDSHGRLWMASYASSGTEVFAIDPVGGTVGEPVDIGPGVLALASCGDRLIGSRGDGLEAIDPFTGESTVLLQEAPLGDQGMDVAPDGGLWAAHAVPLGGPFGTQVARLDLATGEITPIGFTWLDALAIGPPTGGPCLAGGPLTIPTLSPLALVVLAVSLAVAARWVRRRDAQ